MIFIIDNHYTSNHAENCIIVKNSDLSIEEIVDLIGSLGNYYVRCTKQGCCPPQKLLGILCDKFQSLDQYDSYIQEMEFIERRLYSPMLYTSYVMRGKLVIWIDIEEAMSYVKSRMWVVLNEYFVGDDLLQIEKEWNQKEVILHECSY